MNKTILVTGATSQIGIFLLPYLIKEDYSIIAISRKERHSNNGIKWVKCDLELQDQNLNIDADIVIHLAEIIYLKNILPHIKSCNRVITFSSTSALTKINSTQESEISMAKGLLEGENYVIDYCKKKDIPYTIFRPTMIYGADKDQNITFIKNFIKKYSFFPIIGSGSSLRQPVHANDLALAALNTININIAYNKIYNLSGGETISYLDMVHRIFKSLDKKPIIIKIPKGILKLIVKLASFLPFFRHLNPGMVERMCQDLCFDHSEASSDFSYNPSQFKISK